MAGSETERLRGDGASSVSPERPRSGPARTGEGRVALAFLAPSAVSFVLFALVPTVGVVALSLFSWNLLGAAEFVGLDNFADLVADARLVGVYRSTAFMGLAVLIINLCIGLLLAVLLETRMPRVVRGAFRLSFLFPFVVSAAAVALIWRFLLNTDLGLVNYWLGQLGVDRLNWLGSSTWSPIAVVIVSSWKTLGFTILIYIAGLQAIPKEYREAAIVDGAGPWGRFRHVTLPLLSPTILFLVVINTITAFQLFAEPRVLTQGGPGDSSRTVVQYIYDTAFQGFRLGYASTVGLTLMVLLVVLTAIQFRLARRWTHYA
jgi:multiple sugar transport system permease protein